MHAAPDGQSQNIGLQHGSSPGLPHRTFSDAQAERIRPGRGVIRLSVLEPTVSAARRAMEGLDTSAAGDGVGQRMVNMARIAATARMRVIGRGALMVPRYQYLFNAT